MLSSRPASPKAASGRAPSPGTDRWRGSAPVGAITPWLGRTALVYGIVRSADAGWTDALTLAALAVGVVLLAFFVLNERRAEQPIMPLRLFRSRERSGAYAARLLFLGAMMGFWFFIAQFRRSVYGSSPLAAGIAFLPMTAFNFATALAFPRLTHRFGNGPLLAGGLVNDVDAVFRRPRLLPRPSGRRRIRVPAPQGAGSGSQRRRPRG